MAARAIRTLSSRETFSIEDKIRIPKQPCNVLVIVWILRTHANLRQVSVLFSLKVLYCCKYLKRDQGSNRGKCLN